jgi:myosin heavy subunit
MARSHQRAPLLCGLIIARSVTAFQTHSPPLYDGRKFTSHHQHLNAPSTSSTHLSLSNNDNLLEELDKDLAREVEEALLLANDVWSNNEEVDEEEAEIAAIADALTSSPPAPNQREINISPPEQEPSLFTSVINNQVELDDESSSGPPLPPDGPPSPNALSFGESLQKAVLDEIERLKTMLFGLEQDLEVTESNVQEAESTAETLKREIEESRRQREAVIQEIETQFKKEKESLMEQLGSASAELASIIDESSKNITKAQTEASEAEKELLNQIDVFANSIKQATDETVQINMEKEQVINSRQATIDQVKKEAAENLLKYKAELSQDGESVRMYNAKLKKRADEAEKKVRDIYESVKQVREDRISLQQQIDDLETESLEQIATLEKQILEDDEEYTSYLAGERARIDKLISDAKAKYASILDKEKAKRKSIEDDFESVLKQKDDEGKAAISAIESKAKAKLDELEEKHAAERLAIYQEKVEAVSAVRDEMMAQLKLEDEKLNAIHGEMLPKLASVRSEIADVKAAFEQELAERRQVADVEKNLFLRRMETVRSDMDREVNAQRKEIEDEKYQFLKEHNLLLDASEEECRRAWMELATLKKKVGDMGEKRNILIEEVKRKSDLIEVYESDRASFRKSLRLSFKVAKEKIGNGTRRVLRRNKETSDV